MAANEKRECGGGGVADLDACFKYAECPVADCQDELWQSRRPLQRDTGGRVRCTRALDHTVPAFFLRAFLCIFVARRYRVC